MVSMSVLTGVSAEHDEVEVEVRVEAKASSGSHRRWLTGAIRVPWRSTQRYSSCLILPHPTQARNSGRVKQC